MIALKTVPLIKYLLLISLLGPQRVSAREVELTLLHTADLRGSLFSSVTSYKAGGDGGLSRLAQAVEEVRRARDHVLLLDSGDFLFGSPESEMTAGRCMADAFALLEFDACTLGEMDFRHGIDPIRSFEQHSGVPVIAANIRQRGTKECFPDQRGYLLLSRADVTVAVIGIAQPGIASYVLPEHYSTLRCTDAVSAIANVLPSVQSHQPDIIVVLVHDGYDVSVSEIETIARRFPEVDVIIGGHSMKKVKSVLLTDKMLYTQAGSYGLFLGRVDLTYDTLKREVIRREGRMDYIHKGIREQGAFTNAFASLRQKRSEWLEREWRSEAFAGLAVDDALPEIMCKETGADIALWSGSTRLQKMPAVWSERDLWRAVPYNEQLITVELGKEELVSLLSKGADLNNGRVPWKMSGLRYSLEETARGHQCTELLIAGENAHGRKKYRVVMDAFTGMSAGGRYPFIRTMVLRERAKLDSWPERLRDLLRKKVLPVVHDE